MEQHELTIVCMDGRFFIEIDSLVGWFENFGADSEKPAIKAMCTFAAYTIKRMKEQGKEKPDKIVDQDGKAVSRRDFDKMVAASEGTVVQ